MYISILNYTKIISTVRCLLFLLFVSPSAFFGQNSVDTIHSKSFVELREDFLSYKNNTLLSSEFADNIIKSASKHNDTLRLVYGNYFKLMTYPFEERTKDQFNFIIDLSKNLKNKNFPTIIYYDKARYHHNRGELQEALENYFLALEYNKGDQKEYLGVMLTNVIALLKSRAGEEAEALEMLKKCFKTINKNQFIDRYPDVYTSTLFSLSDSYRRNLQLDSAAYYNTKGLQYSLKYKSKKLYPLLLLNSGVINYCQKNYQESLDSIKKSLPYISEIGDQENKAAAYYYLGKLYSVFDKKDEAIQQFKQVDSIFELGADLAPEIRDGYLQLIEYYKRQEDLNSQLYYVEQLLKIDSLFLNQSLFINKRLLKGYDTPILIREKEAIIHQLGEQNNLFDRKIKFLTVLFIVGGLIGYYQYRKQKKYKKSFQALLNKKSQVKKDERQKKQRVIDIPEEVYNKIVKKLDVFEREQKFTDTNITLNRLASSFNTNPKYLSNVVNQYKGEGFVSYIKALRISYCLERLKHDKSFRKYSIKAIANECGFKNAETFSKTFYNESNLYPSYFIKKLNKLDNKLLKSSSRNS